MRLLRKLEALIAMTAICCTLVVPITVNAETGEEEAVEVRVIAECPPHYFVKTNVEYSVTTGTHTYLFGVIDNGDGTTTPLWDTCTTTTTIDRYDLVCNKCGMALIEQGPGKITTHSSCGHEDEIE